MTVYLPTLKQLQYLVALRDNGHFGRAAESCFVTQSTLSAGLRELETLPRDHPGRAHPPRGPLHALGHRRSPRRRRKVLRETEELADMARAEGQPLAGDLRLGVIPTIAPFLLPAMLPRLREAWPDLKLYLREETSQAACDALHRGQLDCVLLAMPFNCGDVDVALLFDDRLARCLSRQRNARSRYPGERRHRRRSAAAARGWPLPEGSRSRRLQPARPARRREDDGHVAPHLSADGRQRPWADLPPRHGGPRRNPRRHVDRLARLEARARLAARSRSPGAAPARAPTNINCSPTPLRDIHAEMVSRSRQPTA